MDTKLTQNYYLQKKPRIMKNFEKNIDLFRKFLSAKLGKKLTNKIEKETRQEYESCLYDYYSSEMKGTGLVRTITLAEVFEKCDFRFKRGRKPQNKQRTQVITRETLNK